jgi:hypothetical protein
MTLEDLEHWCTMNPDNYRQNAKPIFFTFGQKKTPTFLLKFCGR